MWDAGLFCACLDKRPINHYNVIWNKIEEGAPVPSSLKSKLNALSSGAPSAPRPAASPQSMSMNMNAIRTVPEVAAVVQPSRPLSRFGLS